MVENPSIWISRTSQFPTAMTRPLFRSFTTVALLWFTGSCKVAYICDRPQCQPWISSTFPSWYFQEVKGWGKNSGLCFLPVTYNITELHPYCSFFVIFLQFNHSHFPLLIHHLVVAENYQRQLLLCALVKGVEIFSAVGNKGVLVLALHELWVRKMTNSFAMEVVSTSRVFSPLSHKIGISNCTRVDPDWAGFDCHWSQAQTRYFACSSLD